MIEVIVLDFLTAKLSAPVSLEAPEDKPSSFVLIEKTGSSRYDRLERATIAIQSIADTLYNAAALNELVKSAMDSLPAENDSVFRAELDSDYNFTDIESKEKRYQAVYNITYKE